MLLLLLLGLGAAGTIAATRGGPRRRAIRRERKATKRRPGRAAELRATAELLRQRSAERHGRRDDRRARREAMAGISLFGTDPDWSLDPRTGALVRPKPAPVADLDPVRAASDGRSSFERKQLPASETSKWAYDLSGRSAGFSSRASVTADQVAKTVAMAHGVSALRATDPVSGRTSYVFSAAPRTAMGLGKVAGLRVTEL